MYYTKKLKFNEILFLNDNFNTKIYCWDHGSFYNHFYLLSLHLNFSDALYHSQSLPYCFYGQLFCRNFLSCSALCLLQRHRWVWGPKKTDSPRTICLYDQKVMEYHHRSCGCYYAGNGSVTHLSEFWIDENTLVSFKINILTWPCSLSFLVLEKSIADEKSTRRSFTH